MSAQSDFRFKRDITGIQQEGWYSVAFPPEIFQHLNRDMGDVRLYSVENGDTLEIPYLLKVREDDVEQQKAELTLFNKSDRNGVMYLTFELQPSQKVNYLELDFRESNYLGHVTVEGSDDRIEWFEVLKDHRIVSIRRGNDDFILSTIRFPLSSYKYLRLSVTADVPLHFENAAFGYNKIRPGVFHDVPVTWKIRRDKDTQRSVIDIKLRNYVPVSIVHVQINNETDFYRGFELTYVQDSSRTENGWVKHYHGILDGHLTSFQTNGFDFPVVFTNELRLVIRDQDNRPLDIKQISAAGPEVTVVGFLKPGSNFILYGDEKTRNPSYDLTHFENKIPENLHIAVLDDDETILTGEISASPLFENKIWLWSIMGVMIGGLGFFTMKMMMRK